MQEQGRGPQTFGFSDPREHRIYEELNEVVSSGLAAFFRDACWLMSNPQVLQSTSHLVGHLLREIESALRQVFRPLLEGSAVDRSGGSSQKEEIRVILRSLGIHENSPQARAWFDLADSLHGIAHRRGLDAPRSADEIRDIWDSSQSLLEILLRALRERFFSWIKMLDELLGKPQPTKEDLSRLAQEVPDNRVVRQYFFDRLESHAWLEPLRAKGLFKRPPQPEGHEEEGTIRFLPWPEARYLARMAEHKPEFVAEIVRDMDDTDNAAVLSDLVDALLTIPPDVSARLVEKAARWAESPYLLLPEKLGQLLAHWAKGNRTDEALRVARVLLAVLPDERRAELGPDVAYHLPPEPQARFDAWEYGEILKKYYPELVRAAGLPALELLCDLLDKAIRLFRIRDEDQGSEDYSYIWRPAIEDHPQSLGETIKDALVSAVRDAAELVVRSGRATVEEVVDALERTRWKVFRRIALYVLSVFPGQAGEVAAARLTGRSLFEDGGLRHEYVLLLRDRFPRLTPEDQARILGWIEDGPETDQWVQWRERETSRQPSEEDVTRYREIWQRDWLARIGPQNLPTEWRERYREPVRKYGEPEHPEFPVYTDGGWVGPTSLKTADELKTMPVTEIVGFLQTWRSPDNVFREPSPEGLGRVLSTVVAQDPQRFAAEATLLQGLDPTYVRAVLSGLRDVLKQRGAFDWEPVLELCEWVLSQPREIPNRRVRAVDADPDWGWTRKAIADLLSLGFEDRPGGIPVVLRGRVWGVLKPLTDDPDPTPENEQRYGGSNMDPATLSINTTRGEAMHAVARYALWVRRHVEKEPTSEERLERGFDDIPEVREVLEAHLDPAREPSLAVRAVYGQWFPWLVLLDSEWGKDHAARIFPVHRSEEAFFEAAWNTYVVFCRPYDNVWEMLRPQYEYAAEGIAAQPDNTRWLANCDEKLAEHLMVFYWRGKLSLDDPLLVTFWKNAPDAVRSHALEFVGRALKQTGGDIPWEILDRLKQLWQRRLAAAREAQRASDFEKEIAVFGWWFVSQKFEVNWAIAQLSESLRLAGKIEPEHIVLEHLARGAGTHPRDSLACLKMMAERDREGWNLYAGRHHVRSILQEGLRNPEVSQEAERVIHYLGSRGFLDFKDLLQA